jgi:hypothetical protein
MEISIGSDPWFFLYTVNIRLRKKVITRELLGFKRSLLYEKLSRNQELLEFAIYFIIRRHRDDETTRRPDTPKKLHLLVYFFLFSRYPHMEGLSRQRYKSALHLFWRIPQKTIYRYWLRLLSITLQRSLITSILERSHIINDSFDSVLNDSHLNDLRNARL